MTVGSRTLLGLCLLAGLASSTHAAPAVGDLLPEVTVEGTDGSQRRLPELRVPSVVIYEDSDAGKQNVRAAALIDATTNLPANKDHVEAIAVADLERWNFWPARKFALAEVKRVAARLHTTLYIDLKADLRRAWKLTKKRSAIVLLGTDGRVRFSAEGPLTDALLDDLKRAFAQLGVVVPQTVASEAAYHDAPQTPPLPPQAKGATDP